MAIPCLVRNESHRLPSGVDLDTMLPAFLSADVIYAGDVDSVRHLSAPLKCRRLRLFGVNFRRQTSVRNEHRLLWPRVTNACTESLEGDSDAERDRHAMHDMDAIAALDIRSINFPRE
jgi:hypothetical protein